MIGIVPRETHMYWKYIPRETIVFLLFLVRASLDEKGFLFVILYRCISMLSLWIFFLAFMWFFLVQCGLVVLMFHMEHIFVWVAACLGSKFPCGTIIFYRRNNQYWMCLCNQGRYEHELDNIFHVEHTFVRLGIIIWYLFLSRGTLISPIAVESCFPPDMFSLWIFLVVHVSESFLRELSGVSYGT